MDDITNSSCRNIKLLTFSPQCDLLLFKIPAVLSVHKHEIQEIFNRELFINVPHGRRQIIPGQKHPYRYTLTTNRSSIHDLILCNRIVLLIDIRPRTSGLPFDDCNLHVLDFNPHQEEVDLPNDDVLEVVLGLIVLKLDVQAVLNAHLHLDRVVDIGITREGVHGDVELFGRVLQAADYRHFQEVPEADIHARVHFVRFFHAGELEWVGCVGYHLARTC